MPNRKKLRTYLRNFEWQGLRCFVFAAGEGVPRTRILYLHGGAFARQPKFLHWRLADELAVRTGAEVIVAVYPKAPQHGFEETYAALLTLFRELCASPGKIVFAGDSAGANIALGFSLWAQEQGLPQPEHILCFSPCVDLTLSNPEITKELKKQDPILGVNGLLEFARAWASGADLDDPRLSPLYGDLCRLPATTVFMGSDEILLPDVRLFKDKARRAGVDVALHVYDKLYHCFVMFPLKEARAARDEAVRVVLALDE